MYLFDCIRFENLYKMSEFKEKLDQGAPGMSDRCGPLQLAHKPNSVSRINCLLSNLYLCAH